MMKVVLKVELCDDRMKQKAMKAVSSILGVESLSVDMENNKLTLVGDTGPANAVRKLCHTQILSVGPAKEEKKEEVEKDYQKKEDERSPQKK